MNARRQLFFAFALSAIAARLPALAQQPAKVRRIGFLSLSPGSTSSSSIKAFVEGMREFGYVEGKNLLIEWRFGDGRFKRVTGLAAELVRLVSPFRQR